MLIERKKKNNEIENQERNSELKIKKMKETKPGTKKGEEGKKARKNDEEGY